MAYDIDALVDRRRLKRRLTFWRVVAVLAVIGLGFMAFGRKAGMGTPYVARVSIENIIVEDSKRDQLLQDVADDDSAKALIVKINSPGGSTAGSEALYHALRDVAKKKPVVAEIGTMGASGGYVTAIAADYIVARETSLTGSIGVLFEAPEFSGLMEKVGVKMEKIASGPLKAEPSGFKPMDDKVRKVLQETIDDSYDWFVGLVSARRKLPLDKVRELADGRVYTGRQAYKVKLVDALGGEEQSRAWLDKEHKISAKLPVVDVDESAQERLIDEFSQSMVGNLLNPKRLSLDGLVSLWHP